jgi:hypothetical protein
MVLAASERGCSGAKSGHGYVTHLGVRALTAEQAGARDVVISLPRISIVVALLSALPGFAIAQREPGHSIGKVTTIGNLIHLELDTGVVIPEHLFDLDHRTLRFTPVGTGYRIENVALRWDADFGPQRNARVDTLRSFAFPFSGEKWSTLNVAIGAITFGSMHSPAVPELGGPPVGNRTGAGGSTRNGFQMDRYASLQTVGETFIDMIPGIAAFIKSGLNGPHYVKELPDRVVVTWTLSEGAGGIQSFTWVPTVNRIQATLYRSGVIELSYNDVSARDAVVGVFPIVEGGAEKALATISDPVDSNVAENLDMRRITLSERDGLFLNATIETRGAIAPTGSAGVDGVRYRIAFDRNRRAPADIDKATVVWTIRGVGARRPGMKSRYLVSGAGAQPEAVIRGNTIAIKGILPHAMSGATRMYVSADVASGSPSVVIDRIAERPVALAGIRSPEIDLSAARNGAGLYPVAFEGFHYASIPRPQDVACSVIRALGDRFDFLAMYSDFRVDNPEGGTPSTGPRGGNVSGIGSRTNGLADYCSNGELQWMYVEPVSTSAIQIQERSPDGHMSDYNYAMSQIGHELGHRWAADASAIVNGDTIALGPVHWAAGVNLPAAFPYSLPDEADAMGGSTWKDNGDGTWTQLSPDYYSPAKGYSWLGLYLMGLAKASEVPPFFILRNLKKTGGEDADGKPIYAGDRTAITIDDVIAAMGPREPDFAHSQKKFNTGIVVMTMPGKQPSKELVSAADAIAEHWVRYWARTTDGRSEMTTSPR